MDLGLDEQQEMLKRTARDFLEKECPKSLVRAMEEDERGYSPELWKKMADLGWQGLVIPEEYDGLGQSFLDLSILLEEMGRALLPGPFFSTVVTGALPLMQFGTPEQKKTYLPRIASGELIMTFAQTEASATYEPQGIRETKAVKQGDKFVINGTKLFIHNAHVSDVLLVAARTREGQDPRDGITVFIVNAKDPGITYNQLKTIASDKQSEVTFKDVAVSQKDVLGQVDRGWEVVDHVMLWGAAAKCAEMLGGAQKVLDMTVDYAKQRVQFGRPIGSFQAVQHHCANMAVDVDGSRYITYEACWTLSEGLDARQLISMAKAWVSDAYRRVAATGHQVHGGIGFTKDHDMQLYFRRAKAGELAFGDAEFHREMVAQLIGM
jgi:alkylation response protein AidB-like acyl-CoA dehydrogenase